MRPLRSFLVPVLLLVFTSGRLPAKEWNVFTVDGDTAQAALCESRVDVSLHPAGKAAVAGCSLVVAGFFLVPLVGMFCLTPTDPLRDKFLTWHAISGAALLPGGIGAGVLIRYLHERSTRWRLSAPGTQAALDGESMRSAEGYLSIPPGRPFLVRELRKRWRVARYNRLTVITRAAVEPELVAAVDIEGEEPLPTSLVPFTELTAIDDRKPLSRESFEAQFDAQVVRTPRSPTAAGSDRFTSTPPASPSPEGRAIPVVELDAAALSRHGLVAERRDGTVLVAVLEDLYPWLVGESPFFTIYRIERAQLRTLDEDGYALAMGQRRALHPRTREATKALALPRIAVLEATLTETRWWQRLEFLRRLRPAVDWGTALDFFQRPLPSDAVVHRPR